MPVVIQVKGGGKGVGTDGGTYLDSGTWLRNDAGVNSHHYFPVAPFNIAVHFDFVELQVHCCQVQKKGQDQQAVGQIDVIVARDACGVEIQHHVEGLI